MGCDTRDRSSTMQGTSFSGKALHGYRQSALHDVLELHGLQPNSDGSDEVLTEIVRSTTLARIRCGNLPAPSGWR